MQESDLPDNVPFTAFTKTSDNVHFRLTCKSKEDFLAWLSSFGEKSKTNWIVGSTFQLTKIKWRCIFLCHHSNKNKSLKSVKKQSKGVGCAAYIDVKIKLITKDTKKKDKLVEDYPCIVHIYTEHNHNIKTAYSLGKLAPNSNTKVEFQEYFDMGFKASGAIQYHSCRKEIEFSYVINKLLDVAYSRKSYSLSRSSHISSAMKKSVYSEIRPEDCVKIAINMWIVRSESDTSVDYTVDTDVGFCSCVSGKGGKLCKHIIALHKHYNVEHVSIPLHSAKEKHKLAVIALGSKAPDINFFEPFGAIVTSTQQAISSDLPGETPQDICDEIDKWNTNKNNIQSTFSVTTTAPNYEKIKENTINEFTHLIETSAHDENLSAALLAFSNV